MKDLTAILSEEHRGFLQKLEEIEHTLDGRSADALSEALRFLETGLNLHRQKEEEALFPPLAKHFPAGVGPVACMTEEHRIEQTRVAELRSALEAKDLTAAEAHVRFLIEFLRAHIRKEEDVLFPLANRLIQGADRDQVEQKFWDIGACVPASEQGLTPAGRPRGGFRINPEA